MLNTLDFKNYRQLLGYTNQVDLKDFLSAKDIKSEINYTYLDELNKRLKDIVFSLNKIVHQTIKTTNLDIFISKYIEETYTALKDNHIIPRLNNLGRRPEQVYFSWMRGAIISQFFTKALSQIFSVPTDKIRIIGNDRIDDIENFKKQPTADLEINLDGKRIQIEMQSGYQGINDIKEHKVRQAKRQYQENGLHSVAIHFDLFNGQVAFVNISKIPDNDINWITRQQMEGQTVFNIDQRYFVWRLTDKPPPLQDIKECIFVS